MKYLVLSLVFLTACGVHFSEGTRVGTVSKLSLKGFFCKTWEGELLVAAQNVMQPEIFYFSVTDDRVVKNLQTAMREGKNVELTYDQYAFNPPCSPDTSYRIRDVK